MRKTLVWHIGGPTWARPILTAKTGVAARPGMRSFIIHMSSSTARRSNVDLLCSDLPDASVVEAVDGRKLDRRVELSGTRFTPHYPFAMRGPEIGVFESHRKIWAKMVDENIPFALIVEDDLQVDNTRFDQILSWLTPRLSPEQYVRLPVKQRERPAQILGSGPDVQLILPKVIGLQCICQIVGQSAARKLLDATKQYDRPVDTFLQMHWITKQPVHTVLGCGNREVAAELGGSTIQAKPSDNKLAREFNRARYRLAVARRPQRP